jgi:hypothetical protein
MFARPVILVVHNEPAELRTAGEGTTPDRKPPIESGPMSKPEAR